MLRRIPPPRYHSTEGRLVDYEASFDTVEGFPTDLWAFTLSKTYIPWQTWDAYLGGGAPRLPSTPPRMVRGTYALKTLPKEHERSLEDVTVRLLRETDVVEREGWRFAAYERHLRYLSPAFIDAMGSIMPRLQDPGAYHWDMIRNILVSYADSAALDYPRLSDPGYFSARRIDALSLWEAVDYIAQTMAAKWELGFGECQGNPDPNDFHLPNLDPAVEVGGWMLNHFPALRDGELPMPFSRFVDLNRVRLQPQEMVLNVQELADRFGSAAVPDLFGDVWAQRFGYEALLSDLEQALATPEQLVGLGWLYEKRTMR